MKRALQIAELEEPPAPAVLPGEGFVRIDQILDVLPIGASTWWQWVKDGKAPRPIKLSHKMTCWKVDEVRALIKLLGEPAP